MSHNKSDMIERQSALVRSNYLAQDSDGQEESYDVAVAVVEARRSWEGRGHRCHATSPGGRS